MKHNSISQKPVVLFNDEIAPRHFRLRLRATSGMATPRAGQFVHISPREAGVFDPLWRRAFSVASSGDDTFDIIYRVEGSGTKALSAYAQGEKLDVLGPLGKPFEVSNKPLWLVGGGVGVPPLLFLAQQERGENAADKELKAFVGAKSKEELLCIVDFANYDVPVWTCTDDGSDGVQALVTELLDGHLQDYSANPLKPLICACGPTPMLRAVAQVCAKHDVPCQVSLEQAMPCGVGVCNGCVVESTSGQDDYERYRRICVDGPAMWAHEIAW